MNISVATDQVGRVSLYIHKIRIAIFFNRQSVLSIVNFFVFAITAPDSGGKAIKPRCDTTVHLADSGQGYLIHQMIFFFGQQVILIRSLKYRGS
jgi:hypothetical protein